MIFYRPFMTILYRLFVRFYPLPQCCGSGIFIPDPTKKERCKISLIFFLPDQMITVVNDHTKFNFSSFSIFFKGIHFIIYQFHYFKFNFGQVWDPRSGIRKKIIPDPWGKKAPDPQHCPSESFFVLNLMFLFIQNF
jgi:hypothetical protein